MTGIDPVPREPVTINQVHWRSTDLIEVSPVLLVSEFEPVQIRSLMARYIDGRQVNDALRAAIQALRADDGWEPGAYVVVFPDSGLEIPIDLRSISDREGQYAGFVLEPRGSSEVAFDCAGLTGKLADRLCNGPRDEAVAAMKAMSADGQAFVLADHSSHDEAFAHHFEDGRYWHAYHYVAATIS
jgi:hypothetical protein